MAELLLKWRVRKLTGHCGERSFSACLCALRIVLLCGGDGRGGERRGEEGRGGEGREGEGREGERRGKERRGEERRGERVGKGV